MKCAVCNYEINKESNFCHKCGAKISLVAFCIECGNKVTIKEKFCGDCGKQLNTSKKTVETQSSKVDFYIVPMSRLIILSISSLGLYAVYWFVKNFQAISEIRKVRKEKTYPVFWGIFNIFTASILFKELNIMKIKATGTGFDWSPALLGVLYIIGMFGGQYIYL